MLLASLKNFSLAILHNLSFYTDISKNNLFFNQIVQGVCSCFSLFNLQGTPPAARGSFAFAFVSLADSSDIIPCIPPFVKRFFQIFPIFFFSPVFDLFRGISSEASTGNFFKILQNAYCVLQKNLV